MDEDQHEELDVNNLDKNTPLVLYNTGEEASPTDGSGEAHSVYPGLEADVAAVFEALLDIEEARRAII